MNGHVAAEGLLSWGGMIQWGQVRNKLYFLMSVLPELNRPICSIDLATDNFYRWPNLA